MTYFLASYTKNSPRIIDRRGRQYLRFLYDMSFSRYLLPALIQHLTRVRKTEQHVANVGEDQLVFHATCYETLPVI